jgi:hypothetical protein
MVPTEIEKRLNSIERDLAALKAERRNGVSAHPARALEQIHGAFEDDGAFREAVRLGRKWRKSQCPTNRKTKSK